MKFKDLLNKLCKPSYIYLLLSFIGILCYIYLISSDNQIINFKTRNYFHGGLLCYVTYSIFWIILINYICKIPKIGKIIAWLLVLFPILFIIFFIFIISLLITITLENNIGNSIDEKKEN
jgi:hypothetical protein